jgi:hypothetical protein
MTYKLLVASEGAVTTITLNRPEISLCIRFRAIHMKSML